LRSLACNLRSDGEVCMKRAVAIATRNWSWMRNKSVPTKGGSSNYDEKDKY